MTFSPFEEHAEAGAAGNPMYAAIGMTIINAEDANGESDPKNAFLDKVAAKLPGKEPLAREEVKENPTHSDEVTQEDPYYVSLSPSEEEVANDEQVEIDIQRDVERSTDDARCESLAGADGGPPCNGETGVTVLILDGNDNDKKIGESES